MNTNQKDHRDEDTKMNSFNIMDICTVELYLCGYF